MLALTTGAALQADLEASSFRVTGSNTAAAGETVPVTFTVENRGGAPAGPNAVAEVVLSSSNSFASPMQLAMPLTFSLAGLEQGQTFQRTAWCNCRRVCRRNRSTSACASRRIPPRQVPFTRRGFIGGRTGKA